MAEKKARIFIQALKSLPNSIIAALAQSLKCKAPLEFYKAMGWLTQSSKGTIAVRFANKVAVQQVTTAPTIAEYIE